MSATHGELYPACGPWPLVPECPKRAAGICLGRPISSGSAVAIFGWKVEPARTADRSRVPRAVWLVSEAIRVQQVEREIALRFGFGDFRDYLRSRRAMGWGYNRIARETGQHRDWV